MTDKAALDIYAFERRLRRRGFSRIAGADEAGRGACAGPLVAAAVMLPARGRISGLMDSKLLTPLRRDELYDVIIGRAERYAVTVVAVPEVDDGGVHRANLAALRRAVAGLGTGVEYVLTDGFTVPGMPAPSLGIWKGDQISACIAAASVLAKVTRDRLMSALHTDYPIYEFDRHKGYITSAHTAALRRHGPCTEHRRSFVNVAAVTPPDSESLTDLNRSGSADADSPAWSRMAIEVR
ncbi:MAG TPA: ribonuclease HII [Mycobacteriales bacterium]|nr:ribonuclease HII [Mycobacteriales bacterium]